MLTELIQALIARLAAANVPLYLADCVPEEAALPYVTLAAVLPLGDGSGTLTLTAWHTTNAGRIALAEDLAALLPPRGTYLPLGSGAATLHTGTVSPIHEAPLLGLRMVWKLRCFPA